ncbi:hypothetical protein Tco_1564488 [Tanacetum coccineum]
MKEISDTLNNLIPELTIAKTDELIKEAAPRLNIVLNMYPTPSTSIATSTTADLKYQLYLKMKLNLQDQAVDPDMQHHYDHIQDFAPMRGRKGEKANKDFFFLKYRNSEERKYVLSLHKIHVIQFPEEDLEEKMNRWVRKEFKTFNEEARLSIQHWKDYNTRECTSSIKENLEIIQKNISPITG